MLEREGLELSTSNRQKRVSRIKLDRLMRRLPNQLQKMMKLHRVEVDELSFFVSNGSI